MATKPSDKRHDYAKYKPNCHTIVATLTIYTRLLCNNLHKQGIDTILHIRKKAQHKKRIQENITYPAPFL